MSEMICKPRSNMRNSTLVQEVSMQYAKLPLNDRCIVAVGVRSRLPRSGTRGDPPSPGDLPKLVRKFGREGPTIGRAGPRGPDARGGG